MSDMAIWLRAQIAERRTVAERASSATQVCWDQHGLSGELYATHSDADPYEEGRLVADFVDDGEALAHAVLNDPQDVIARCDAELAILKLHETTAEVIAPGYQAEHNHGFGCPVCHDWDGATEGRGDCETVGLIARSYRHRPGFKEEWKSCLP